MNAGSSQPRISRAAGTSGFQHLQKKSLAPGWGVRVSHKPSDHYGFLACVYAGVAQQEEIWSGFGAGEALFGASQTHFYRAAQTAQRKDFGRHQKCASNV